MDGSGVPTGAWAPIWASSPVIEWLLLDGGAMPEPGALVEEICRRLNDAGMQIGRCMCMVPSLHPLYFGTAYRWRDTGALERTLGLWANRNTEEYVANPIHVVIEEGAEGLRRRLVGPQAQLDFPVLVEFRDEGFTDYVILPLAFISGQRSAVSYCTRKPTGFTTQDLRQLNDLLPVLARILEIHSLRTTAANLLDTYVGRDAGMRILNGSIRRGMAESLHAAIWYCDLRDFTALSERIAREAIVAALDDYFETMATAVHAHDGQVLKFIGDGLLAIFPIGGAIGAAAACHRALDAAAAAEEGMATLNRERNGRADPLLDYGLALHIGEVMYGNIGASDRLDFTVIGPAVNVVSRIEPLCKIVNRRPLVSRAFAETAARPVESVGRFMLRGLDAEQEVFTVVAA